MTNSEKFNLSAAFAKYRVDSREFNDEAPTFEEWAEKEFLDENAIISEGCVFSNADIEKRLADFESRTFEGYLLEFKMLDGSWRPSEVDTLGEFEFHCVCESVWNEYFNDEIFIGFFKELGNLVWSMASDSWVDRLGVDFDSRTTPIEKPSAEGEWEGEQIEDEWRSFSVPTSWRVRRIKFKGTLSDKARKFLKENPLMEIRYTEKGVK